MFGIKETEYFENTKVSSLKGSYPVYKPNPLLLARDNMRVMQARFFTAYLCKIQPSNPDTYKVKFSFSAFCKLLDLDMKNIGRIKAAADAVLECKFDFAEYIKKHGNYELDPMLTKKVNLFEVFEIVGDSENGYFVEVTPTRPMEYLLQKQKKYGYVKYKLKNTINLSTTRNIRLYEFLKRAEGIGVNVDVPTLKAYLGMEVEDYPQMKDFKRKVLDKGLKEINSNKTDIEASYTEIRKGQGGKIVGFKFVIKNKKLVDEDDLDFDEDIVELSQNDIDLFNIKKQPQPEADEESPNPEMVKVTLQDGKEAWAKRSSLYSVKDNNYCDKNANIDEGDESPKSEVENLSDEPWEEVRENICAGFSDDIFAEFNLDQLEELKSLAWHNIDDEAIERHANLGNRKEQKEYAVAEYVRRKILLCNAKGKEIKSRYAFIKRAVAENYR